MASFELKWLETTIPDGEHAGRPRLIMTLDDLAEVVVDNYGAEDYKISLRTMFVGDVEENSPAGAYERAVEHWRKNLEATDAKFWGVALVWAEPRTIAHLVHEVIFGQ